MEDEAVQLPYKECPYCEGAGRVLDTDAILAARDCNKDGHIWNGDPPCMFCDSCGISMPEQPDNGS